MSNNWNAPMKAVLKQIQLQFISCDIPSVYLPYLYRPCKRTFLIGLSFCIKILHPHLSSTQLPTLHFSTNITRLYKPRSSLLSSIYCCYSWRKTATMVWTCKENARKQAATANFRMGTRRNAKKGKTQREMDRWSKTEHDKPWTDGRGY
jgi:hypothetical protein